MKAKLLCVYDEGALEGTSLIGANGLSILIEVDGQRTLFDTGMRGSYLLHNMDCLNVDVSSVDRVVISHCHKAHIGGMKGFMEARKESVDVFWHPSCDKVRNILGRPLFSEEASSKMNVHEITEETELSEHLLLLGPTDSDSDGELYLVIKGRDGPVVITGCCHSGVSDVMAHVKASVRRNPGTIVGGTHLHKMKQKDVDPVAASLMKDFGSPMLYLNHCTDQDGITCMRVHFGLKGVKEFYVGEELLFEL